jgi:hypothetical protein
MGNKHIYSEPVGISVNNANDKDTGVLRGVELLKKISEILGRVSISSCEYSSENITTYKEVVKTRIQEILSYGLSRAEKYIRDLEGRNLSHIHNWVPGSRGDQKPYRVDARYLGTVILSRGREAIGIYGIGTQPTQEHVRRVEEIAMRVAMDYERRMGREPRDVSMRESYDILSIDPGSGEARYIEVKGISGTEIEVELTEREMHMAREMRESYWIYIVYGIGLGSPRLLTIRDPLRVMKFTEIHLKRYRGRL